MLIMLEEMPVSFCLVFVLFFSFSQGEDGIHGVPGLKASPR